MCVDAVAAGRRRRARARAERAGATSSLPRALRRRRGRRCAAPTARRPSAPAGRDSSARSVTRSTSGAYFARIAGPVHAVHLAVVEVVALEAPGLGEHLPPLVARVEPERASPTRHDLRLRQLGCRRRLGAGVEDVDSPSRLAHQHLLAVGRQLVAPHVLEERLELGLLLASMASVLSARLRLRLGVAVDDVEALGVDSTGCCSCRRGTRHFDQPALDPRGR